MRMNWLKDIIKGVLIGIANIIPGVSGGTMMVSMGVYDKIISSVNGIFRNFVKSILTLLPYAIGMVVGIGGLSFGIEYLFGNFPLQTSLLFIGLIFGGLPVILRKVKGKKVSISEGGLCLLFFAFIVGLQLLKEGGSVSLSLTPGLVVQLFFVGILASAAMVIPGVSGSMILMSLGFYNPVIETVNQFIREVLDFNISGALQHFWILLPFGIGIIVGILAIAKLIEFLLKRFERLTYFAILGLILASPVAVLMGIGLGTVSVVSVLTGIVTFALGFAGAWCLAVK